jgi:hypothetical protein
MAAEHILHMQKSLSLMNVQIHHVLSDITGFSGLAILDAILAGERDCVKLAKLCHSSVKSPRDKIAQALEGDYRPEHLFVLQQSLSGYRYYQQQITELDREIQQLMKAVGDSTDHQEQMPKRTKRTKYNRQANDPSFDLSRELYRIAGVDLTDIPGVSTLTAQAILTEIGPDVSRFRNASAFASWLGLCPEKRISGGRVLSCKTRKVKSRAAIALRLGPTRFAAQKTTLENSFAVCVPNSERRKLPRPRLIRWRELSITSSEPRRPITKLSFTSAMNKPGSAQEIDSGGRLPKWAFNLCPSSHKHRSSLGSSLGGD